MGNVALQEITHIQTSTHPFSKILVYLQAQDTVEKQCSDAGPLVSRF